MVPVLPTASCPAPLTTACPTLQPPTPLSNDQIPLGNTHGCCLALGFEHRLKLGRKPGRCSLRSVGTASSSIMSSVKCYLPLKPCANPKTPPAHFAQIISTHCSLGMLFMESAVQCFGNYPNPILGPFPQCSRKINQATGPCGRNCNILIHYRTGRMHIWRIFPKMHTMGTKCNDIPIVTRSGGPNFSRCHHILCQLSIHATCCGFP